MVWGGAVRGKLSVSALPFQDPWPPSPPQTPRPGPPWTPGPRLACPPSSVPAKMPSCINKGKARAKA